MVKYTKGSTIAKVTPWKAIPLFDDEEDDRLLSKLPHRQLPHADHGGFPDAQARTTRRRPHNVVAFPDIPTTRIRQRILQKLEKVTETNHLVASTLVAPSVVVALHLWHSTTPAAAEWQSLLDSIIRKELRQQQQEGTDSQDQAAVVLQQDTLVKIVWEELNVVEAARERPADGGLLDWNVWLQLLTEIARSMRLVVEQNQHPLLEYATQEVPHLHQTELQTVCDTLQLDVSSQNAAKIKNDKTRLLSPLAVQKWIRDHVEERQPGRIFAVLLSPLSSDSDNGEKEGDKDCSSLAASSYKHSCLPTAQLELTENGTIAVTALYDIQDDEDVCISWICEYNNHSVEERDAALQMKMGHSCTCLRCRYEMGDKYCSASSSTLLSNVINDATRLARYYMATGDLTRAKELYTLALKQLQQCSTTTIKSSSPADLAAADLCHVLGAIDLTEKKFLSAQRIWKQAADNYTETNHPGIAVQLEKMKAYDYFKTARPCLKEDPEPKSVIDLESPIPGAFIARVIDDSTCQQVIDWAEKQGEWTRQRHYAVPTYDVPVHSVPELLHWFQHNLMTRVMQPLLARQFKTKKGCFYVHDAFVVRYAASYSSNHLPIHADESTHSFVLALNDDFEGGGTYFYERDEVVRPPKGCTLSFGGDMLHGGESVTSGFRYILAVFLYHDEDNPEHIHSNDGEKHLKREAALKGTISKVFRESKQQKTEAFSFGFAL